MNTKSVLQASDKRSPFYINVPTHEARPITHLLKYFKLWKHFISSLISYLKDLVMAKEFELNLNLQLIGSVQFPGNRDLSYRCLADMEQNVSSPLSTPSSTPKAESNKTLGVAGSGQVPGDSKRPQLPKTKSASSFLKNQTFAHKKNNSSTSLRSENYNTMMHNNKHTASPKSSSNNGSSSHINAAKLAQKPDVIVDPTYFPDDSLFNNVASCLINHHMHTRNAQEKLVREVTHKMIPKLESLHRNLGIKIKEIKSLLKDESFANTTLIKEVSKTGNAIKDFSKSIDTYSAPQPVIRQHDGVEDEDVAASRNDPFLIKLGLDFQLKNQLIHENYIFALFVNLQAISKDLLNYVIKDLNSVSEKLTKVLNAESVYLSSIENCLFNLGVTLKSKIQTLDHDWQFFMTHNKNFLNTYYDVEGNDKKTIRSFNDVVIPFSDSVHSKCLRCGYIYKKQKLLKSYVSFFYVLTCNYLHEFKIETNSDKSSKNLPGTPVAKKRGKGKLGGVIDHDDTPVKSYNLNDYSIQLKNDNDFKFVLIKTSNLSQKFTFKCKTEQDYLQWSTDLHDLLKFGCNHLKRFKFIEDKMANRNKTKNDSDLEAKEKSENVKSMKISLSNLLSTQGAAQPQSLNGMFTPRVMSPSEHNKNPFDSGFDAGTVTPKSPLSESGGSTADQNLDGSASQVSPQTTEEAGVTLDHKSEHENYLKLQNEILLQQKKLLESQEAANLERPGMSRHSSAESVLSFVEQSNNNMKQFLNHNKNLTQEIGANDYSPSSESMILVPTFTVSSHEHK